MTGETTLMGFSGDEWSLLLLNSLFYFGLGVFLYGLPERRAMNRGLLGQY
ncbi:MAG: hypothetical protein WD273_01075 [Trueperaceae bacterium]